MDLVHPPDLQAQMAHLGYPVYFATILGAWKVLGAIAIAAPKLPRVKEWAYAGMAFDLTGAALSHAMSGDAAGKVLTPLVLFGLVVGSYLLRPAARVLPALDVAPAPAE